jgi:probable F420-dependent oxidoreductase
MLNRGEKYQGWGHLREFQKNVINRRRNDRDMKFGVCVPNYGESSSTEALRNVALEAERAGCGSLWTTDHILMPKNSGTPYERIFDSITTLAFLADVTDKVQLGISSLIIPMRNPVIVAKQLATIDNLSDGRLMLTIGAGWNEKEFAHLGSNFHNRGKRLDASIRLIRALWKGETSFKSRVLGLEFSDAVFEPRPIQKHLTIWIGGTSKAAMKRAATLGDAWHPNVQPLDQFAKLVAEFRESSTEAKTKEICVRIAINPRAEQSEYKSPQGEKRIMLSGNQAQNKQILARLEELGVSYVVAVPSADGKASIQNQVDAIKTLSKLLG